MTSGSVPPADGPPGSSSTTPTDGPPSEPRTTEPDVFPISRAEFSATMLETFQAGWKLARMLTQENPPDVEFRAKINPETQSVDVETIVHGI